MLVRILLVVILTMAFTSLQGCKKEPQAGVSEQQPEITKENLNSELDKMEQQINSEMATQE